ncbi:MAG: matrixin family metalloprotease [Myxococcota bacterium]
MKPLVAAIVVLAVTAPASAWNPIDGRRPVWCGPAQYFLNQAGSADLGFATTEAEVNRGMQDWALQACTGLTSTYQGTTDRTAGVYEGTPTISWSESGWRHDARAIGVTGPTWTVGGGGACIREADMDMNGVNYNWTTNSGRFQDVNAYSIILHEGGHYYGLGHSNDRNATMFASYAGGISALNADDQAGICSLYPGDGPVDCTVSGCPTGQECVSGSCRAIMGDGTICSPCGDNSQCGGANDQCVGYPDGGRYCGTQCFNDSDCPGADFRCAPLRGGGSQCARVDGRSFSCAGAMVPECSNDSECEDNQRCESGTCVDVPTDLGDLGAPCTEGSECNSGFCFTDANGGVCARSCDWLDPMGSCPAGFYCNGSASGACGDGVCLAGAPGAAADGDNCTDATDCASLYCSAGRCGAPCQPGQADSCAGETTCQMGALAGCGACLPAAELGQPCDSNESCESLFCAVEGDTTFCTDLCDDENPCPAGFECLPAGPVTVCAPRGGAMVPGAMGRRDSGCCSVAPGQTSASSDRTGILLLAAVAGIVVLRRRRRR